MDTPLVIAPTSRSQPLPALSRWTVATLAAIVFMLIYLQVGILGQFFPPLALIFGVPALLVAAVIAATRWRWAPLLGVLYWILLIAANSHAIPYDITHPEYYEPFAFTVVVLALAVIGALAGASATIQNYGAVRTSAAGENSGRVPRTFWPVLWSLTGLCLGALLVGAIPQAGGTSGPNPEALAALPALGMENYRFGQAEMRVQVNELVALRLENRGDAGHSFDIDEFNVHVPVGLDGPSLALFTPDTAGAYTYYCGVPGHRELGMEGMLIVEP